MPLYKSVQDDDGIEVVVSRINRFVFHFHPQQHFLILARGGKEEDEEQVSSMNGDYGMHPGMDLYLLFIVCLCVSLYLHLELIAMSNTVFFW